MALRRRTTGTPHAVLTTWERMSVTVRASELTSSDPSPSPLAPPSCWRRLRLTGKSAGAH
eukprot:11226670-Lingulodinium_polyedra.AAC.1